MKVVIQKPDLDTCLAALILGVRQEDRVIVSAGEACLEDLMDAAVLCIEAGGSGLVHLSDFDHHDPRVYHPPACRQAYAHMRVGDVAVGRLVDYVCEVDEGRPHSAAIAFLSLSSVFSGMLMVEKTVLQRFFVGVRLLQTVLEKEIDPFFQAPERPEWSAYIAAKGENRRKLAQDIDRVERFRTQGGLTACFLETDAAGAPGALRAKGCDVAVACSKGFGTDAGLKYTVTGKGAAVASLKGAFDSLEGGWGGRGSILCSPRKGTRLNKAQVLRIISEKL